jgi:hypothetical protein
MGSACRTCQVNTAHAGPAMMLELSGYKIGKLKSDLVAVIFFELLLEGVGVSLSFVANCLVLCATDDSTYAFLQDAKKP